MDSRDRVIAACARLKVDHPPTGLGFTPDALELMRIHLGLPKSESLFQDVLDELDVDLRWLPEPFIGPEERSVPTLCGEGKDYWGIEFVKVETETDTYYEIARHPLAEANSVADVEAYDWPSLDWWDYSAIPALIDRINVKKRRAIMFLAGGTFETTGYLCGMEKLLIDLCTRPEIPEAIFRHLAEYNRQRALRFIDAARGKIDIVASGSDIGTQRGMIVNPEVWRKHVKPSAGQLISTFKEMGFNTFYHSCGSILPVIEDLVELGLDLLDPIQVRSRDMTPENLYARFGNRLSFHGAIDEQELLPHGTAAEVYNQTRRTIDILGKQGGYVVSATQQIQADTPPENVVAMIRAAQEYRW